MNITLNSKPYDIHSQRLSQLFEELSIETKGIAIGLNGKVVARALWAETTLNEGDSIVIVSAVFGG